MSEQTRSSNEHKNTVFTNWHQKVLVFITFGLFLINYFQYQNNKNTLTLLSEQQKYGFMKPRLTISREYSRLSDNKNSFIIRIKNVGNSPASNIFLALERPIDTTKHYEFYEQWAFIQGRDTTNKLFFEEDYLQPQEISDISINIENIFDRELEGKTNTEKELFFLNKVFDLYIYFEDLEGRGNLTYCRIGPYMKHGLTLMGPRTAKVFRKYRTPKFDWKIRYYENVNINDTTDKK